MSGNRNNESQQDEQYSTDRSPIEREVAKGDDGSETGRNVAAGAGAGTSLLTSIGFVAFFIVLVIYIIFRLT